MKLAHQINLAFGVLIALVIAVTAIINHYVLLDHFVGVQKQEMQAIGAQMTASLKSVDLEKSEQTTIATFQDIQPVVANNVEAILTDKQGNVVYGNVPTKAATLTRIPISKLTVSQNNAVQIDSDQTIGARELIEGKDSRYVVSATAIPQGTLTLYSPMSKINAIEQALLGRLLIVLCVSGAIVYIMSLLITNKLIKPLMKLRGELKKVESRQFSEVRLVKAGGEIGAVAQTVYDLAGELDRYNQAQKQFFQNASHELKTPLMSIAGYAEGIRDGVFEGEGATKGLNVILSESGRLKNIVTEMTLLAKLDSEEDIFQLSEVDVRDLLTETRERVNPLLLKKGLEMQIQYGGKQKEENQSPMNIWADRDKISQALLNVVSNASRYARERIIVDVAIEHDDIRISITDDGAGFSPALLPYLFHRFVKGKDGETGLGLAISRAIVERCRGRIAASNRKEGGAVITMAFPFGGAKSSLQHI
ncbi:sensor histidine kinase [Cohnella herbarum]|uniref:histidine kinase n=1 Tax=Cohnella herbarum TaxID=2728023 RepID=A0A7Z2VG03_9BACL|nr:HAMP domain-containing sensor histidine kinase [Cohnella herbarum]QJD82511.1 HAMP domain-containing histidine kinase [Cohnella herbarum]